MRAILFALFFSGMVIADPSTPIPRCEVVPLPGQKVSLRIDGIERAMWHFGDQYERPFFYPITGPSGSPLTRVGHPGAENHDHHRSVWLAHHDVEGLSFWANTSPARIQQKHWYAYVDGDEQAIMAVRLGWFDGQGREVMDSDLVAALRPVGDGDATLELQLTCRVPPGRDSVALGKTNFGFLAVRVAKSISGHFGGGAISNSEGAVGEKQIFGKPARWMDYSGRVPTGTGPDRKTVREGITYFDHPDNPRYPTHWHVREDGWMGASFCMQAGITIRADQPLTLRYLLHAHTGEYDADRAGQIADSFAKRKRFNVESSNKSHRQYEVSRQTDDGARTVVAEPNRNATISPGEWKLRRAEIVSGMQSVMGPFPGEDRRVELDVRVEEQIDMGSYVRRLITLQSEPDCRTPAYLCIPKRALSGQEKVPAVLCLHPTDNQFGHKVVVGLGGRKGRQYAAELAERGFVTLSPAYPHLANYWPNLGKLGYGSGTMKAIWDNTRALDLLSSLSEVDDERGFGVIGHSLGGHNAIFTAVFDERISVLVTSCGFDSFQDYYDGAEQNWYFGKGWCQTRYMPRMSDYRGALDRIPFDFPDLLASLSPRKVFINAPLHDSNFHWKSVDRCAKLARQVYEMHGAIENVTVRHPDCGHDFPQEMREAAYDVLGTVLFAD